MRTRKEYLKDLDNLDIPESHYSFIRDLVEAILNDAEQEFSSIAEQGNIRDLHDLSNLVDAIDAAKTASQALY